MAPLLPITTQSGELQGRSLGWGWGAEVGIEEMQIWELL